MHLIDSKAEKSHVGSKPIVAGGKVIDIMAALEASINAIKQTEKPKRKRA
jgi:DNA end-binding protein Ku